MTKRAEFTKRTKREALARSGLKCEAVGKWYGLEDGQRCYAPLAGGVEFDHIIRAADGGDNSLENCAAVCKTCHSIKTAKFDTPQAAKTKRMADKNAGIFKTPQPIKSRGFAKKERAEKLPVPKPRPMYELWPTGSGDTD